MGQNHKRLWGFKTPFPPLTSAKTLAACHTCGAICSKNRKIVPYRRDGPNARHGVRLWSPSPMFLGKSWVNQCKTTISTPKIILIRGKAQLKNSKNPSPATYLSHYVATKRNQGNFVSRVSRAWHLITTNKWHKKREPTVSLMFLPYFDDSCDLFLNVQTQGNMKVSWFI